MRKQKVIFWIFTVLALLPAAVPAFTYFYDPTAIQIFTDLGFPGYFRIELAILKMLGLLALVLPFIPRDIKVVAYGGFMINMVSASVAFWATGAGAFEIAFPLIIGVFFLISYIYFLKLQNKA